MATIKSIARSRRWNISRNLISDAQFVCLECRSGGYTAEEWRVFVCQCHPTLPVLATSGIGTVVRLWSPLRDAGEPDNLDEIVNKNQERMKEGPQSFFGPLNERTLRLLLRDNLELVQLLTGRRDRNGGNENDDDDEEDDEEDGGVSSCRVL